jgi:hypothetical protein
MSPQSEARMRRIAHFPLELLVIAVLGAVTYGQDLVACSPSTAPPRIGASTAAVARSPVVAR